MKKLFALLLALCLLVTLVACDRDEPTPGTDDPNTSTTGQTDAPDDPSVSGPVSGETIETALWNLTYDPAVWTYNEDDLYQEDDYAKIILIIPDDDDGYEVSVEIRVSVEDASTFRDYLDSYGFDAYEYAVNHAYELTNVGGVDCLMQEGNYWGDPCLRYFNRAEGAGTTVFVEIIGNYTDASVAQLLAGLNFKLTETGNVDMPWPWEGEPFSAEDHSVNLGNYTISSQWVSITDPLVTKETFDHAVVASGSDVYLLTDGLLKQYTLDGNALTFVADVAVDGEFDSIQATADGSLWLSGFMEPLVCIQGGVQAASHEGTDVVTMAPDGTWGISWFSSAECEKVTISGGTVTTEPMVFGDVNTIMHLMVDESYIYVCGTNVESDHVVFVYDHSGVLEQVLTDADGSGLGSITYIARTANGFIGLDGNMRELVFWSADGTHLGTIEDSDIFGTSYPWFCGATKLSDGSILVIMTEDRADESAMELVAFKLSGF